MPDEDRFFFTAGKWEARQGFDPKWFDNPGFLIHPFDKEKGDTFLLKNNIGILTFSLEDLNKLSEMELTSVSIPDFPKQFGWMENQERKESFKDLVGSIRSRIESGEFEKVVSSRVEVVEMRSNPWEVFINLAREHPRAFVSFTSIESLGQWIGASPELLCRIEKGRKLKTVSLAGTSRSGEFGEKEIEEQEMVSNFIEQILKNHGVNARRSSDKETFSSGTVSHLRSGFEAVIPPTVDIGDLISELHPTPAVAGIPQKESVSFISQKENHPRAFYSGFLGPFASEEVFTFYVNLRCMQVFKDKAVLYSGAGITKQSDPAAELEETEIKIQSLKNALE